MSHNCMNHEVWVSFGGEGSKGLGTIKKVEKLSVRRLAQKLSVPSIDASVSYAEYMKLSVDEQGKKKAAPGFLIGGKFKDNRRKVTHLIGRWLMQIDIDNATPAQVQYILDGSAEINEFCYLWHTTRKHAELKPRIRILVPVNRRVDADQTNAITRILSTMLALDEEESIEIPDLVSFRPNQIAYLPSVSRGQGYRHGVNEAPILDVDAFLAAHPGWDDIARLPRQQAEKSAATSNGKTRAEDPTSKKGIVGAFCRAYRVEEAIETFLPDIYIPGDESSEVRYTFAFGTGSNGAVVYDGGLFLHSHHGSDPAEGLNNAFDLVRKHLFGDLDEKAKEGTTPGNMPSFRAMAELAEGDKRVREELAAAFDFDDEFDDLEDEEPETEDEVAPDPEVGVDDLLDMTPESPKPKKAEKKAKRKKERPTINPKTGKIEKTFENLVIILRNDPRVAPCVGFNVLRQTVCIRRELDVGVPLAPVTDKVSGRPWQDADTSVVRVLLSRSVERKGYETEFSHSDIDKAINAIAAENSYNPFLDLVQSVEWDGVERIDTAFIRHLKCEDLAYVREAARAFFIATICRQFEPGHPFHLVPILSGDEGGGKTGFFKAIAYNARFYGELHSDFSNIQKMVESTQGKVIMEIPELKGFRRNEMTDIKQYFTSENDTVRLSYDRRAADYPRFCVYAGTTNETEYLLDGDNRRFLPIPTPLSEKRGVQVDFKALQAEVPQLWAEALHRYLAMRKAQPEGELALGLVSKEAKTQAWKVREQAQEAPIWATVQEVIQPWLDTPVTAAALAAGDDLVDQFDREPGDTLYVRNLVTATTVQEALANHPVIRGLAAKDRVIGTALKRLPGWRDLGRCRRAGRNAKWYARDPSRLEEFVPMELSPGMGADPEIDELLS